MLAPVTNRDRSSLARAGVCSSFSCVPNKASANAEEWRGRSANIPFCTFIRPYPGKKKKKEEVRINIKLEEENKLYRLEEAGELH